MQLVFDSNQNGLEPERARDLRAVRKLALREICSKDACPIRTL